MKLFTAAVLCCSFLYSWANPLPLEFLDCDAPDVFKAVDAALKKYNGERETGNQFALYMVMEAKRTVGPDTEFYVKYRIQETTCAIEENKLWQDCDYRVPAEAETGECTARVHMNGADKTSNVSQDCKIFPATPKLIQTEATCTGCFYPISSDSLKVSDILTQTIQKFNKHSAETALFKLVEIKEAKIQVVAGWNYIIKYEIEETNCSKDQFQDLTPECKLTSRGRVGKCEAKAYENLHGQIVDTAHQCKLPVEETVVSSICTGCPKRIPKDSPELKDLLKASMEKYNLESNDDFYYKGGEIRAATVQVVAGKIYRLIFTAQRTNCSKKEFENLPEDCEVASDSVSNDDVANWNVPNGQVHCKTVPLPCEAQIYMIPWDNKVLSQVNCSKGRSMELLMRRPPGFTPFRTAALAVEPSGLSYSDKNEEEKERPGEETRKDGGQEPEGEGEPEHKDRHKHGHKHRHGDKKDHESDKRHRHQIRCGHRKGHRCGHQNHGRNGKHKQPDLKSSEESHERGFNQHNPLPSSSAETAPELVNPGAVREETGSPAEPLIPPDTSLFNGLTDRAGSPLPRCPGKPWKQITGLPASSDFPREFTNEDLLPSAAENANPGTENSTPQSEEKDLDLSDALP